MKNFARLALIVACALLPSVTWAWSNHTLAAYRALESMPEAAQAPPVTVEPLEAFLQAEEKSIAALLAEQEVWAQANLPHYPPRPDALVFRADPTRSGAARRQAFLQALRIAPDSKFALYLQPDPWQDAPAGDFLPYSAVNTLPAPAHTSYRFLALCPGATVAALAVLASATDEPDYGLDINLWSDSPSDWGKLYGFGPLPFGNPALPYATQAPFHMGFFHESRVLYLAAPFLQRTFPLLRHHQFATLAALAFRTGHTYWGWRFTGLALHYLQDLTQPYHASLAPGHSTWALLGVNLLAALGAPGKKNDMVVLLSNHHLALEKYQFELLQDAAHKRQASSLDTALRDTSLDQQVPPWRGAYVRDVVSAQSAAQGSAVVQALQSSLPAGLILDPAFDFGVKEDDISLTAELAQRDVADRQRLQAMLAQLLGQFGAYSRTAVRAILQETTQPATP